jgi:O-acetylserine/cysteine efflux transporter
MKPAHLALVLLINAVWGFSFIVAKVGVGEIPPILFAGLRFMILAVILAPLLRWHAGQMRAVLGVSLLAGVLHFAMFFLALALGRNVSSIAIAVQLNVPFVALLSVLWLKEVIHWRRALGIALAFGGVVYMGFEPTLLDHLPALGAAVSAAFMIAVATILMRGLKGIGVFQLQAWIAAISGPGLILLSFLFESGQWEAVRNADWRGWGAVLYTVVATSLIGHGGVYFLVQRYPASQTAPLMLLAPVIGVACGVTINGDELTPRMVVGGLVAIVGVLIITVRERALKVPTRAAPEGPV